VVRLAWILAVPTVPVSDFAMYRESANYLSEFGHLDPGFIYMPGFVMLLAWVKDAGGGLVAQKMIGVLAGTLGAAALFALAFKLVDERDAPADGPAPAAGWRRVCPCPHAATAALIFALWPAGVAMSSVVGTDMPAAAMLALALALLVTPKAIAATYGRRSPTVSRWASRRGSALRRCRCRRSPCCTGWPRGRGGIARRC